MVVIVKRASHVSGTRRSASRKTSTSGGERVKKKIFARERMRAAATMMTTTTWKQVKTRAAAVQETVAVGGGGIMRAGVKRRKRKTGRRSCDGGCTSFGRKVRGRIGMVCASAADEQQKDDTNEDQRKGGNGGEIDGDGERKGGSSSYSMKEVISDLDAILGIEPEPEVAEEEPKKKEEPSSSLPSRAAGTVTSKEDAVATEVGNRIYDMAKNIAKGEANEDEKARLREEFDGLLELIRPETSFSKEDIKLAKEKVFGPTTFWVTSVQVGKQEGMRVQGRIKLDDDTTTNKTVNGETSSSSSPDAKDAAGAEQDTSALFDTSVDSASFRGNLRADKESVFSQCSSLTEEVFKGKYTLFMTEDMEAEDEDPRTGRARVVFQMVPTGQLSQMLQPTQPWEYPVAFVLVFLTAISSVQLGLVAQIDKIPRELLESMSQLAELGSEDSALVPDDTVMAVQRQLEATGVLENATPIVLGILAATAAHELAQWGVAKSKRVELGLPFLVPTPSLGTFGSLRSIKSLVKDRTDLFDIAAAGPIAALSVSAAILAAGIVMSGDAAAGSDAAAQSALIPVPEKIFQGSLFLGTLADVTIPHTGTGSKAIVMIHPLFIAGWCGLSATAFQLLPLGSTDGGRIAQSAYGRGVLALASLLTYGFLAFGIIGGTLSLQYGLLALLWARSPSRNILNDASEISSGRQAVATSLLVFALLTLLPNIPPETFNAVVD